MHIERASLYPVFASAMAIVAFTVSAQQKTEPQAKDVSIDQLGTDPNCEHRDAWGPYVPKPGHPTPTEKKRFLESTSSSAREAEMRYGAPAAAITAMAVLESGYGFTRLALNANNIFGYRYPPTSPPEIRRYVLKNCYAASGPDLDYAQFRSFSDAVDFVSGRFLSLRRYAPITSAYSSKPPEDRTIADIQAWVKGIASAGYSGDPMNYSKRIIRIMNDPYHPQEKVSPENLYILSVSKVVMGQ